ncbi:unnamed protein product, partial [Polarella glacialis]
ANLRIGFVAEDDVDLLIQDDASKTWLTKWDGGIVNRHKSTGTFGAVQLKFSSARSSSRGKRSVEEFVQMDGVLSDSITAQVTNFDASDASVLVLYSWDSIEAANCPRVPRGCQVADGVQAASSVKRFAAWLAQRYSSE